MCWRSWNKNHLTGNLDFIPHLSCKDSNADGLTSSLVGYRQRGVETVLALTGDKPVTAKGVFEVESVGLLSLIKRLNQDAILKAKPGNWDKVHQFFAGAAVSPFKYTEPSLMQQYYKMEKKIAAGAQFLITQVGWDWKKSRRTDAVSEGQRDQNSRHRKCVLADDAKPRLRG